MVQLIGVMLGVVNARWSVWLRRALLLSCAWYGGGFSQVHGQPQGHIVVSGTVRDGESGETLPGAHVQVRGTQYAAATNNYGFYSLRLPRGTDSVWVSYVGYSSRSVFVRSDEDIMVDVELSPNVAIEQVVIEGQMDHNSSRSARMGTIAVPKVAIQRVPMLLGERDALRVIQLLPGVQKGMEGMSGFYVRGGGPDQNLIILDEAPVYNAFHLMGMFSLFNGSAIKSMELLKGGFPARYGGRLASVLEMVMDDGNMRQWHGELGLGLISSHGMVQGPIVKDKASVIVTARRTYLDVLVRPFLNPDEGKPTMYFYDLTAKVNWQITPKDRIYLSGYFGRDEFGFEAERGRRRGASSKVGLGWGNATGTLRWNRVVNHSLFSNLTAIYSQYDFLSHASESWGSRHFRFRYTTGIQNVGLKYDVQWNPLDDHTFRLGVSSLGYQFTPQAYRYESSFSSDFESRVQKVYSIESAVYAEDDWRLGNWARANVGVRMSHYGASQLSQLNFEPRASLSVFITRYMSAKAAFAMMNQSVHLLSSFGINLPMDIWVPATRALPQQRSWIASAGVSHDLPWIESTLSVEGYYKRSAGNIAYRGGTAFRDPEQLEGVVDHFWEGDVTRGTSWSGGVEVLLQRKLGRLSGWVGYTLSWTQFHFPALNNGEPFWARHDRRHDVSVVGLFDITPRWRISASWVYGTGMAISLPSAVFEHQTFRPGYREQLEEYKSLNSSRMAPYHRLDLGVQYVRRWGRFEGVLSIDVYNAYNRYNPFFYYIDHDFVHHFDGLVEERFVMKQITLFPLIPSLSYRLSF